MTRRIFVLIAFLVSQQLFSQNAAFSPHRTFSGGTVIIPDLTFSGDGIQTVSFPPERDAAKDIVIQPDGKIVVVGYDNNSPSSKIALTRLLQNGKLDSAFGTGGKVLIDLTIGGDRAYAVALQTDGKIVVGANAVPLGANGDNDFAVLRYLSNGTLDTSFGTNGFIIKDINFRNNYLSDLAIQADGKILIVGITELPQGSINLTAWRITTNGITDSTFNETGYFLPAQGIAESRHGQTIELQSDGKILLCGFMIQPTANVQSLLSIRLKPNGTPDSTYGATGEVIVDLGGTEEKIFGSDLDANGNMVVACKVISGVGTADPYLVRLKPNGSRDSTFGDNGVALCTIGTNFSSDYFTDVKVLSSGNILAVGVTNSRNQKESVFFSGFTISGDQIIEFGNVGLAVLPVGNKYVMPWAMALQEDEKFVVAGEISSDSVMGNDGQFFTGRYAIVVIPNVLDLHTKSYKPYPQPLSQGEELRINLPIDTEFTILNNVGSKVFSGNIGLEGRVLKTGQLPSGIYLFTTNQAFKASRFLIE